MDTFKVMVTKRGPWFHAVIIFGVEVVASGQDIDAKWAVRSARADWRLAKAFKGDK
jgi:hypothetical protein